MCQVGSTCIGASVSGISGSTRLPPLSVNKHTFPRVAFSNALRHSGKVHVVKVTGGQWYWVLRDGGYTAGDQSQANTKKTKLMPLLLSRQLWKIRVYSQLIHLTILN